MKNKLGKPKKKGLFNLVTRLVAFTAIIGCIVSIAVNKSSHADMQKELNSINKKTEEIAAENVELQRILEDDDMDSYMEKLAIEKMNYAYPDERRYYDTSRN